MFIKSVLFSIIFVLFIHTNAFADSLFFKPFSTSDYILYGLDITANTADMLTTLDIKNVPYTHETNIIMGPHPTDAKVIGYFAAVDVLEGLIGYALPPVARKALFTIDIGVESYMAYHNYNMGLKFAF